MRKINSLSSLLTGARGHLYKCIQGNPRLSLQDGALRTYCMWVLWFVSILFMFCYSIRKSFCPSLVDDDSSERMGNVVLLWEEINDVSRSWVLSTPMWGQTRFRVLQRVDELSSSPSTIELFRRTTKPFYGLKKKKKWIRRIAAFESEAKKRKWVENWRGNKERGPEYGSIYAWGLDQVGPWLKKCQGQWTPRRSIVSGNAWESCACLGAVNSRASA